jgi:hypothetical protein
MYVIFINIKISAMHKNNSCNTWWVPAGIYENIMLAIEHIVLKTPPQNFTQYKHTSKYTKKNVTGFNNFIRTSYKFCNVCRGHVI